MEDIIAIALILVGVASAILAIFYLVKKYNAYRVREAEEAMAERQRQIEATRKWRESLRAKPTPPPSPTRPTPYTSNVTKPSYAPSPTQSIQQDDSFMDGMMTALVINTLMNSNKDSISGVVTRTEDSDGRVSISMTDSEDRVSSSSFSSSSDSWSSSSDSGPSSDW